jgi:glycosyltransferase involved in cell wall biosynthesis
MSKPFISIIIPVYNGAKTLGFCLESIFKSSYPKFECIVVDDHSNDNSVEIAEGFASKIIKLNKQQGAAYARNRGCEAAQGDIVFFVDADVTIYPDTLEKVVRTFENHREISAVFGSYDDQPWNTNFLSQYKNLFHHYIHQTSLEDASTFWTGCGAIKREIFFKIGKFNENRRMMEDIELGYKLKAKNYKILLVKYLTVKHLKHYSFLSLLKSDFFDRAIPWTILMLNNKQYTRDLNLKLSYQLSAMSLLLLIICCLLSVKSAWFLLGIPILLSLFFFMNKDFYYFFLKKKGPMFVLKVIPLHFLYYFYSSLGFIVGYYKYYLKTHRFNIL